LDLRLSAHFPGSQQTGHPPERKAGEGIKLDLLLSDRNMKWSNQSFKPHKSTDPGGITPAHIQKAGQIAINWLHGKKRRLLPEAGKPTHTTANKGF